MFPQKMNPGVFWNQQIMVGDTPGLCQKMEMRDDQSLKVSERYLFIFLTN